MSLPTSLFFRGLHLGLSNSLEALVQTLKGEEVGSQMSYSKTWAPKVRAAPTSTLLQPSSFLLYQAPMWPKFLEIQKQQSRTYTHLSREAGRAHYSLDTTC